MGTQTLSLAELQGSATGRIFVMGAGPSLLKQRDLVARLGTTEDTFCCNRTALWDGLTFTPTYYACTGRQVRALVEPDQPPHQKYRFWVGYKKEQQDGWVCVWKYKDVPLAGVNGWVEPVCTGASQSFIMCQIAAVLGYTEIYLVGCDMRSGEHVFGDDKPFVAPPERQIDGLWSWMEQEFNRNGIGLIDTTPGGRLNAVVGYEPLEEVLGHPVAT